MGLYPIDCPSCGKAFVWFSGNMDQRCHDCQQPKTWWLPVRYQEDSPDTRQECANTAGPYIQVIEKSAFDFQCKQNEQLVKDYNELLEKYHGLLGV